MDTTNGGKTSTLHKSSHSNEVQHHFVPNSGYLRIAAKSQVYPEQIKNSQEIAQNVKYTTKKTKDNAFHDLKSSDYGEIIKFWGLNRESEGKTNSDQCSTARENNTSVSEDEGAVITQYAQFPMMDKRKGLTSIIATLQKKKIREGRTLVYLYKIFSCLMIINNVLELKFTTSNQKVVGIKLSTSKLATPNNFNLKIIQIVSQNFLRNPFNTQLASLIKNSLRINKFLTIRSHHRIMFLPRNEILFREINLYQCLLRLDNQINNSVIILNFKTN